MTLKPKDPCPIRDLRWRYPPYYHEEIEEHQRTPTGLIFGAVGFDPRPVGGGIYVWSKDIGETGLSIIISACWDGSSLEIDTNDPDDRWIMSRVDLDMTNFGSLFLRDTTEALERAAGWEAETLALWRAGTLHLPIER